MKPVSANNRSKLLAALSEAESLLLKPSNAHLTFEQVFKKHRKVFDKVLKLVGIVPAGLHIDVIASLFLPHVSEEGTEYKVGLIRHYNFPVIANETDLKERFEMLSQYTQEIINQLETLMENRDENHKE